MNNQFPYNRLQERQYNIFLGMIRATVAVAAVVFSTIIFTSLAHADNFTLIEGADTFSTTNHLGVNDSAYNMTTNSTGAELHTTGAVTSAGFSDYTIEFWSYVPSYSSGKTFWQSNVAGTSDFIVLLNGLSGSNANFCIEELIVTGHIACTTSFPLSMAAWHHIAIVMTAGIETFYVDGAVAAGSPSGLGNFPTNSSFYFARNKATGFEAHLPMDMSDFKFSKVARTGTEIANDYNSGTTYDSNVIALWCMVGSLGNAQKTNRNLANCSTVSPPGTVFTSTASGSVHVATPVTFTVAWTGQTTQPQYLYFYPHGRPAGSCALSGCTIYGVIPIREGNPLGESGSLNFNYSYTYAGAYAPTILFSPDCNEFHLNTDYEHCTVMRKTLSFSVTGPPDNDTSYNIALNFDNSGNNGIVNVPEPFEWRVDAANQCSGSSISSKTLFAGYPPSSGVPDNGVALTGTSGSGSYTFLHTKEELGAGFVPYLRVICANGTTSTIYNGDTLYAQRAVSLTIVSADFNKYWVSQWIGGGKSPDYDNTTGSGAYFYTDQVKYARYQPVLMRFYYKTPFTPNSVVIYPDPDQLPSLSYTLTGASITNQTEHNYNFPYTAAGQYFPKIQVRSASYNPANSATFRNIWLGGNQVKDPAQYLTVTTDIYSQNNFNFTNTDGIFGLDPSTFAINFGNTSNPFLQDIASGLSLIVRAGLYVLNLLFTVLKNSPVLSFLADIIHPANGQTGQYPTSLYGFTLAPPADAAYTVAYADPSTGSKNIEFIVRAVVGSSVMLFVLKSLIH